MTTRKPMNAHVRNAALASAAIPLIMGAAGMMKLGRFHWPLAILCVCLAGFGAFSAAARTRHDAKYGPTPINSIANRKRRESVLSQPLVAKCLVQEEPH